MTLRGPHPTMVLLATLGPSSPSCGHRRNSADNQVDVVGQSALAKIWGPGGVAAISNGESHILTGLAGGGFPEEARGHWSCLARCTTLSSSMLRSAILWLYNVRPG